jgi:phosphohistidine phosphatase SixA
MKNWIFILCCLLANEVYAFQTIYLVRHAEKQSGGSDPQLSLQGQRRALDLAMHLRDASIQAIFVSEYQRTQKTAQPLADLLKIKPTVIPGKDLSQLITLLQADTSNGAVLVVGHSNTVPEIVQALGVPVTLTLAEDEYDLLVNIALPKSAPAVISILRY